MSWSTARPGSCKRRRLWPSRPSATSSGASWTASTSPTSRQDGPLRCGTNERDSDGRIGDQRLHGVASALVPEGPASLGRGREAIHAGLSGGGPDVKRDGPGDPEIV